jgi:hypothetical protein
VLRGQTSASRDITLNHPNIVSIFHVDQFDGSPYILGMQRSATVFHGVREAKVTTDWRVPRAPAPTDLIHCVPSGSLSLSGSKSVLGKHSSNQPLAAPTPGMPTDEAKKRLDG